MGMTRGLCGGYVRKLYGDHCQKLLPGAEVFQVWMRACTVEAGIICSIIAS